MDRQSEMPASPATGHKSAKEYLGHSVQSLGKAFAAFRSAEAMRKAAGHSEDTPIEQAYFWTMDALLQGVAAFVCVIDEASAAHQLIEDPHSHKLFEPALIRRELLLAGQFLSAFELLMGAIVGQLRASFYTEDTPPSEKAEREQHYAREVLSLDKSSLRASCLWLKNQGVLSDDDIRAVDEIRRGRNDIAHRLPALIFTSTWYVPIDKFRRIAELVARVDMWWLARQGSAQPRSWVMVLLEHMLESVTRVDLGPDSPLRPAVGVAAAKTAGPDVPPPAMPDRRR